MLKPLIMWITTNSRKFFKRWEHQTTWPSSWETCMQVKKQQLELGIEQQISSKLGKENIKVVYCYRAYLTYMLSTLCEMPDLMKHKLESRLLGEISVTSDMQMTPPLMAESEEELKSLLMKVKKESEKACFKTQNSENSDHGIQSHYFISNRWGNKGNSDRLYFLRLQNHCRSQLQQWN